MTDETKYIGSITSNTTTNGTDWTYTHGGSGSGVGGALGSSTSGPSGSGGTLWQPTVTTTTDTWTGITFRDPEKEIEVLRSFVEKIIDKAFEKESIKENEVCLIKVPNELFDTDVLQLLLEHIKGYKVQVVFIPETVDTESIKFIPEKYISDEIILAMKLNE